MSQASNGKASKVLKSRKNSDVSLEINAERIKPTWGTIELPDVNPFLTHLMVTQSEITASEKVFSVERDTSIVDCVQLMFREKLTSIPVVTKHKPNHKFYGFIDLIQIVNWICKAFSRQNIDSYDSFKLIFEEKINLYQSICVADVMKSPFVFVDSKLYHCINARYSLFYSFELLARGLKRIAVCDSNGTVSSVLTTSSMMNEVHKHWSLIPLSSRRLTVADLILPEGGPFQISENARPIDAFTQMINKEVHALSVFEEGGKLSDVISLRDLRGIELNLESLWKILYGTIKDFKSYIRIADKSLPNHIVYVKLNETLEHCVSLLLKNKINHIFVVDELGRARKCISGQDILRNLLPF